MKLVLLTGFMGDPLDWFPTTAALVKFGIQDVSILSAPYRACLPAEPFVLCGYSMGGRVAISLANTAGCRGVISVSSSPGIRDESEARGRADVDERIAQRLECITDRAELRSFLTEWWSQPVFGGSTLGAEEKERLIASRLKMDPCELSSHLREFGPGVMPSLWDQWSALPIPKLAIAGERDPKYVALAQEMGECQIVAESGHQIPLEQPERLAQLIANFFAVSAKPSVVN